MLIWSTNWAPGLFKASSDSNVQPNNGSYQVNSLSSKKGRQLGRSSVFTIERALSLKLWGLCDGKEVLDSLREKPDGREEFGIFLEK